MTDASSENQKNDVPHDPRSADWWKVLSSAILERDGGGDVAWPDEILLLRDRLEAAAKRAGGYLTSDAVDTLESRCEAIESRLDRIERRLEDLGDASKAG